LDVASSNPAKGRREVITRPNNPLVVEAKYDSLSGGWCSKEVAELFSVGVWKHIRTERGFSRDLLGVGVGYIGVGNTISDSRPKLSVKLFSEKKYFQNFQIIQNNRINRYSSVG